MTPDPSDINRLLTTSQQFILARNQGILATLSVDRIRELLLTESGRQTLEKDLGGLLDHMLDLERNYLIKSNQLQVVTAQYLGYRAEKGDGPPPLSELDELVSPGETLERRNDAQER